MLTDERVLFLRKEIKEKGRVNQPFYAKEYDVGVDSIGKAIRGDSFKHLNATEAPVKTVLKKHEQKEKARELSKQGFSYNYIKQELGVSKSSLSNWCRDIVAGKESVTVVKFAPSELKEEARTLYQQGKTCPEIAEHLNRSLSTVSRWCSDLSRQRRLEHKLTRRTLQEDKDPSIKRSRGRQALLTDEQVLALRKAVKADRKMHTAARGKALQMGRTTIRHAVIGKTFKHLNSIEAPVTADMLDKVVKVVRQTSCASNELIAEVIALRRENPALWSYGRIAEILSERTGRKYQGGPTAILLVSRDPSLKELEKIKPLAKTKEKKIVPKKPKVPKFMSAADIARKRHETAELRKAIAEADRYEQWANAGFPDDWGLTKE